MDHFSAEEAQETLQQSVQLVQEQASLDDPDKAALVMEIVLLKLLCGQEVNGIKV